MGRSVSYPTGSVVAFRLLEDGEDDDIDWVYECLVDEIIDAAKAVFPSFERFDGWRGREDRILLRNAFADCGISTYCGLAAIWLVERDDPQYWEADFYTPRTARARHWLAQVSGKFIDLFGELRLVGRFSNGEAIRPSSSNATFELSPTSTKRTASAWGRSISPFAHARACSALSREKTS